MNPDHRRIAGRMTMTLAIVATVLPVACGSGRGGVESARSRSGALDGVVATSTGLAPSDSPDDSGSARRPGRRDLERAERSLSRTRAAVSNREGLVAGASLALTIRELEDGLTRSGAGITPAAATTFEDARRAADRWQAGEPPSERDSMALLNRIELEAVRLARALRPSGT